MAVAFIGLGANIAQPLLQLKNAVVEIAKIPQTKMSALSSFYGSKPMGPQDQPDYINAVCGLETQLEPIALLDALQEIELSSGRVRKDERWGARTLDLDILLFDQQCINSPRLTVPHYGLKKREFVLYPLAEIAPELLLPCGSAITTLANNIASNGITILDKTTLNDIL